MGGQPLILLDTHVLLWLDSGDERLSDALRQDIDEALAKEELAVAAITFWEVAMLQHKGRIRIEHPLAAWRRELLEAGLHEVPLDGEIGILAASLEELHADPADRLIVATASIQGATLLTGDERLLEWPGTLLRRDARQ